MDDNIAFVRSTSLAESRKHLYHHIHMSISMLGLFIAYSSMQNLVSSIVGGDTGYWSLATIYIFLCVSSLTIGPMIVTYLKPKYSLLLGSCGYVAFIVANRWPSTASLIPTAALVGIGGSILWTAQGTYLTQCSTHYARKRGESEKSAMGVFNGIFFAIFQINQIFGNLIAGFILGENNDNAKQTLAYVYMGTAGFTIFSFIFLIPEEPVDVQAEELNMIQKLFRTIILLGDKRMLLLLPVFFYSGFEQGFVFGSFTKDIVGESVGAAKIGFVMAVFGGCDVIGSFVLGRISDRIGTPIIVFIGWLSHIIPLCIIFVILQLYSIEYFTNREYLLYITSGLFGVGDAAWNTFPNIMVSILFTEKAEPAFANIKFWQSLGTVLPFGVGAYLSIHVKLAVTFGFLWIAIISMIYLQIFFRVFTKKKIECDTENSFSISS